MSKLTKELKEQIMADYRNREIPAREVRAKYGLSSAQMTSIILEFGGEFRRLQSHHPKRQNTKAKICPHCRKKIDIVGARYCPFCATDIRSEAELLKEDVQKLYSLCRFLPASDADKASEIIGKMLDYLGKEAKH